MIEILAVVCTLISVYLTIKTSIWCWHWGIVGCVFYMVQFYNVQLYGQFLLQIFFIGQCLYGIYYWGKKDEITLSQTNLSLGLLSLLNVTGFSVVISIFISTPFLDIYTTLLSLLGTWLLSRKEVFGWIVWIITDIFMIVMFFEINLLLSALLYVALLVLSIKGLLSWTRNTEMA